MTKDYKEVANEIYLILLFVGILMSFYLLYIGELDKTDIIFFILILSVYWKVEARQ